MVIHKLTTAYSIRCLTTQWNSKIFLDNTIFQLGTRCFRPYEIGQDVFPEGKGNHKKNSDQTSLQSVFAMS